jgi:DNA-binding MarR family transcriptional regulator
MSQRRKTDASERNVRVAEVKRLQASSVGYLLIRSGQLWNERAIRRVNAEAQGPVLREAHTRLLPHLLEPDGIRITELARRLAITKQAVQPLVADMVAAGVLRMEDDPDDARARRVILTAHGFAAMRHGTGILLDIEATLGRELGKSAMSELRRLLTAMLAALTREDPEEPRTSPALRAREA